MPKPIELIVACSENRVIGRDGRLPWSIPEDFRFFEQETAGKICILGRVCYETWPRAAQEGRTPIIISRDSGLAKTGVHVVPSLPAALDLAESLPGELRICGGQRIYEESFALGRPLRLQLTLVHVTATGDRYFPEWRHLAWQELSQRESRDENYRYTFFQLEGGPW